MVEKPFTLRKPSSREPRMPEKRPLSNFDTQDTSAQIAATTRGVCMYLDAKSDGIDCRRLDRGRQSHLHTTALERELALGTLVR